MSKPRNVPPPSSEGARTNPYARFIPREELSSFAAWALGDISGVPSAANSPNRPREPEPAPVDPAELVAQQLRAARQSGYQDGYRDGLVALEGFKQSFAVQTTMQVGALVASIGAELDALQQDMAKSLAATATHLARRIVRSELTSRPECVAQVAEQAIEALLQSARHIVIRIHPEDLRLVESSGAAETIAARGARLVSDSSLSRGGCKIESDIGGVDATIDERWRQAAAALGCDDAWDGSAAPVPSPDRRA